VRTTRLHLRIASRWPTRPPPARWPRAHEISHQIYGGATITRRSRWRVGSLAVLAVGLLLTLAAKLWYIQVSTGASYASLASQEQIRTVIVPPVRGLILDDTGRVLVGHRSSLTVTVNLTDLSRQAGGGAAELRRLSVLLGISDRLLRERLRLCTAGVEQPCWPGSPYQPIPVRQHVPERVAVQIMEEQRQLPGVAVQVPSNVSYPLGSDAAQFLGYLQPITAAEEKRLRLPLTGVAGTDLVGQSGLEAQYDGALRGLPGTEQVAVDAAGNLLGARTATRPVTGDNLVTSINAQVQADTERALANAIHKAHAEGNLGATSGAAVVMTTTGRVLAMASYPSYNPGVWAAGLSERQYRQIFSAASGEPILDRPVQGQYAPGSTWKVTTTAAAVAAGYTLSGPYDCPGSVSIGGRTFYNDNPFNSGPMSLHTALVVSCDTVFYQLGYDIWLRDDRKADVVTSAHAPVQAMQKMELAWGFGKPTGIDLPGEASGTVPTRAWLYDFYRQYKKLWCRDGRQYGSYVQQIEYQDCRSGNVWEPGQAVEAAIGQGYVTVTPLQLARAYAALANGGTLYAPRIGEALVRPDGRLVRRITPPVVGHLPVSARVLAYIRDALADVVTAGTAAPAFTGFPLSRLCVAGKTGTAQVAGKEATSVFASYAPCAHPRYVVVMMIPASGYGADVSAPAVRQIWDGIYGLEGHRAALPGGELPSGLPGVAAPHPAGPGKRGTG
jgi:penicillin-binding protein 2